MLKRQAIFVVLLALVGAVTAHEPTPVSSDLEASFRRSTSMSFYFVSRTGTYRLTEKDLMKEATLRITRECANNCAGFMNPLILHLRKGRNADCQLGQESLLIVPSNGPSLLFSRSGRLLRYGSRCYFTETGVNAIIKSNNFLFN